jgi:hypothetical protein
MDFIKFRNFVQQPMRFYVRPELIPKIEIGGCQLTDVEIEVFNISLKILYQQLIDDKISFDSLPKSKCIFFDKDTLELDFQNDNVLGTYLIFIIYRMNRIRNNERYNQNPYGLILVFLEELCHCYYNIDDETAVKHKVLKIIQKHLPECYQHSYQILKSEGIILE